VSRRSKRRQGPHRAGAAPTARAREEAGAGRPSSGTASPAASGTASRPASGTASRAASGWGLGVQLAFLVAVFGVVVLVAELAGAANLGVALGVGQIAFAIAVIYLLLRR
jgi:hypothetical protein